MFAIKNKIENTLSFKHFSLINLALSITDANRAGYVSWIFAFLTYRWRLFPTEYENVVKRTAEFIADIHGETPAETVMIQKYLLRRYTDCLPVPFVYDLFVSPIFKGKWESLNPYKITNNNENSETAVAKTAGKQQKAEPFKPIESENHIEYLKNNPNAWFEVFKTIAANNNENPHNAVLGFIKEYIIKHGTSELSQECLWAITNFAWQCPLEDIVVASEIRRKLP